MRLGMDTFSQLTGTLPFSQTPSCQLVQKFSQQPRHTKNRTRGYLPPGLRGAAAKGSPRPNEDNRSPEFYEAWHEHISITERPSGGEAPAGVAALEAWSLMTL